MKKCVSCIIIYYTSANYMIKGKRQLLYKFQFILVMSTLNTENAAYTHLLLQILKIY